MRRKIYDKLLEWKRLSCGETAVIINGARRVGKSYVAKEFAAREYRSYILLDFNNVDIRIRELFEMYLNDLDTFFMYLGAYTDTTLYKRDSVII